MFYDIYMELCREQKKDPYSVPLKVGYKSNSVVAQWKNGSTPRGNYLDNLCEYFNVSKQHLLELDTKKPFTPEGEGFSERDKTILSIFRSVPESRQNLLIDLLRATANTLKEFPELSVEDLKKLK